MLLASANGIRPGDRVHIVDYAGRIAIVPALKELIRQGRGLLKGGPSLTEALLEERRRELEQERGRSREGPRASTPSERMADRSVLDSFALMALLEDESGASYVQELLERAARRERELFMSVLNLGEVLYTVESRRGLEAPQQVLATVDHAGVSYADCFVGALAQHLGDTIVTGDS